MDKKLIIFAEVTHLGGAMEEMPVAEGGIAIKENGCMVITKPTQEMVIYAPGSWTTITTYFEELEEE
jgi:hypothetical protein